MKFTFKKEPRETGLAGVGHPYPNVSIKQKKQIVGCIFAPNWQKSGWRVGFSILKDKLHDDGNPNCKWMWLMISSSFQSEELAREYVNSNPPELNNITLHPLE